MEKYVITDVGARVLDLPKGTTIESPFKPKEMYWSPVKKYNESAELLVKQGWRVIGALSFNTLAEIGVDRFGTYNEPPANFRELTDKEFLDDHALRTYGDVAVRPVQLYYTPPGGEREFLSMTLHLNPFGEGWGYCCDYKKQKIRWFKFEICKHDWQPDVSNEYQVHNYKCPKCGMKWSVDSSG